MNIVEILLFMLGGGLIGVFITLAVLRGEKYQRAQCTQCETEALFLEKTK